MTDNETRNRIINAAFDLAKAAGWDLVTLRDIAEKCGLTLAELRTHIDDQFDILRLYERRLDHSVLAALPAPDPETPEKDRLFDILMERFDALNADRDALVAILHSFKREPRDALLSAPYLLRSMTWMMEAARIDTHGVRGAARIVGLTGAYLYALKAWMDDDSADLSKTMAALDRALTQCGSWRDKLGL